jgi:hypothetical protein
VSSLDSNSYASAAAVSVTTQTASTIAATTAGSPFNPSSSTVTVSISTTGFAYFCAVCSPAGSSFASGVQTIATSAAYWNKRQLFVYMGFDSGTHYPTGNYSLSYMAFGLNTVQSQAVAGKTYSIVLPFMQSSAAYLVGFTLAASCSGTATCSLTGNVFSISSTGSSEAVTFHLSTAQGENYYASASFGFATGSAPTISPYSGLVSTPNSLISNTLTFADSYYGNTDLYTHVLAISVSNSDGILINSMVRPAVWYWAGTATASITITVTSIGGYSSSYSFPYVLTTSPTLSSFPVVTGWVGCNATYTATYSDSDGDSVILTASKGTVSGSEVMWSLDSSLSTDTVIASDGYSSTSQSVAFSVSEAPTVLISSISCVYNRVCAMNYSEIHNYTGQIASTYINDTRVVLGNCVYTIPTSLDDIYIVFSFKNLYGCKLEGNFIVSTFSELYFNFSSAFCTNDVEFSVSGPSDLVSLTTGVSVSGLTVTAACASTSYYTKLQSSNSYGFAYFALSLVMAPVFPSFPSVYTGVPWSGSLAASSCSLGSCVYAASGDNTFTIQPVSGYAYWQNPVSGTITLNITLDGITFSQNYSITTIDVIEIAAVDQSLLQIYTGHTSTVTITASYPEKLTYTISTNIDVEQTDNVFAFTPSASTQYTITTSSGASSKSITLSVYVLSIPSPYLPSSLDSSDMFCEIGSVYSLSLSKCTP